MLKHFFIFAAVALLCACNVDSGDSSDYSLEMPPPPEEKVEVSLPFSAGVNFHAWFEAASPREITFNRFTEDDFRNVKSMGVDVIRLPINLHAMTGGAPNYTLDPLFLKLLDQAIAWAEKYGLYIILDNHSFETLVATSPDVGKILVPVWRQLAQRYKDRGKYILYEILNEPHGIDAKLWGDIQEEVIKTIREVDATHGIVVGGVWTSIDALAELPDYNYENIIYTFHSYYPYVFTHQGENWGEPPNLDALKGLPFPADAHAMPDIPDELLGTWVEQEFALYAEIATVEKLAAEFDKAVAFSRERGVPVLCGEFGVHMPNVLNEDRVRWYQAASRLLEDRNIARTSWDYLYGFGIFKTDDGGFFTSDLNVDVVKALGFNPPPQKPLEDIRQGFTVFDNYPSAIVKGVEDYRSDFDLYHENGGEFALFWSNPAQYGGFMFYFKQRIDWEYLMRQGYAITFRAKADGGVARFDVRLTDRDDAVSIPWRIYTSVDIPADGAWHDVRVPLSEMQEHGALDIDNIWYAPEGKFSWKNVELFTFVAEDNALDGVTMLFDTIKLEK